MPQEPWLWALAIVAGAVCVLVALALGGLVEVAVKPPSLKFRRRAAPQAGKRVSLLERARLENARLGNVTGVRGDRTASAEGSVDVGRDMTISGGEVGDLTGVSLEGGREGARDGDGRRRRD